MNEENNKNLILAMTLMLGIWLAYSLLFPPQQPPAEQPPAETVVEQAVEPAQESPQAAELTPAPVAPAPLAPTVSPARDILVETDKYRAVFTTAGARLTSFELKDYRATAAEDSPLVQMFEEGPQRFATLRTSGTEGLALAADAAFETSAPAELSLASDEQQTLTFRTVTAAGIEVIKTFVLTGDRYTIETRLEAHNRSQAALRGTLDLALVQQWDEELYSDSYTFAGPATLSGEDIDEVDVDDLEKDVVSYGPEAIWTSFQTKYFLSVIVPQPGAFKRIQVSSDRGAVVNQMETAYLTLHPGDVHQIDAFLYIGPKEHALLKDAGHQLDKAVHFGFFDLLAKPLFHVLIYFYGYLQNYGLAIILLTIIIKLIFWPLTHKSYSSMKAMQKLQPEMQKLREKFKNDRERMNKELMELYKTHRVNPLGGCLPMLVQIPVFFALYKVLLDSIALRHAPFAFWLTDLSAKDPYYITPILMGISMFVQQKMTPTQADPTQAKIFMMMPVIFTFLFLNFPCGLVIYWLVNNLLTIAQQYYIHKTHK